MECSLSSCTSLSVSYNPPHQEIILTGNNILIISAGSVLNSQQSTGDFWDDDWDDDSEIGQTQAYVPPSQQQLILQPTQSGTPEFSDSISTYGVHSVIADRPIPSVPKKNNKFSTLVKSSEDGFLLCTRIVSVPEPEKIFIEEKEPGRFTWVATGESYNCVITSPKKESKLKGLKSFIVYQLTPTVNIKFFYLELT